MGRLATSLALVVLVACNAVEYPVSPTINQAAPSVAPTRLTLHVSPPELPRQGGTAMVHVETTIDGVRVAPGVRVTLNASAGTLERADVTTDGTGHALVAWSGSQGAIVSASAGDLQASAEIRLAVPQAPPPIPPPPPAPSPPPVDPIPTPTPTPAPPPAAPWPLQVVLDARTPTAPEHIDILFVATVPPHTLGGGETIVGYGWDWDNNGTVDATSMTHAVAHGYPQHGVYTARVTVLSSLGRVATATTQVTITN